MIGACVFVGLVALGAGFSAGYCRGNADNDVEKRRLRIIKDELLTFVREQELVGKLGDWYRNRMRAKMGQEAFLAFMFEKGEVDDLAL
jgi:hypothetical protein